jgi:hypothetical protein
MEVFAIIAILWSLPWKGVALWKASRNYQKGWFVALLIIQSVGVLEIIYLIGFQKDKNPAGTTGSNRLSAN